MSTASVSIRDRFEKAYVARTAALSKVHKKQVEPKNKEVYGKSYY